MKFPTEDTHFNLFSDHIKVIHPEKSCCNLGFNSQLLFDIHYAKKHHVTNEDGFILCPICTLPTSNEIAIVLSHIRMDHHNQCFKCPHCDKIFDLLWRLTDHIKSDHAIQNRESMCTLCGKKFKNQKACESHLWRIHNEGTGPVFTCEVCGRTFKNSATMQAHRKATHNTEHFNCDKCDEVFATKNRLQTHLVRMHRSS